MNLGIIGHDGQVGEARRGVRSIEGFQQVEEKPGLLTVPDTLREGAGSQIQSPRQIALLVRAWRHHLDLVPFRHPLIPDLG